MLGQLVSYKEVDMDEEEYEQLCWDNANNIVDEYEDYGLEWGVDTLQEEADGDVSYRHSYRP